MRHTCGNEGTAPEGEIVELFGFAFTRMAADEIVEALRERSERDPMRFVVTPNAQHVVSLSEHPEARAAFAAAWMTWCDSKPISLYARLRGRPVPHVTGSDMLVRIFQEVLRPGDTVLAIVASEAVLDALRRAHPTLDWIGYVPPPRLDDDPEAMDAAAQFVASHPARFVLAAVGAPRSEIMMARAQRLGASGTGLCVGAGVEFLIGWKRRAPRFARALAMEWLFRAASEPRRLGARYATAVPGLLRLMARDLLGRDTGSAALAAKRAADSPPR